ncbi:MAG: SMC family ATPase [Microscillaceae bacterium]|nr:SMC family ATPase [Microscillaceae bacterium]
MKPISLEIEAFGAFATKQLIQFDVFEENRLFLIHGPTGSGKTTIFDAMCYALYGQTTGNRQGKSMRSDHVDQNIATRLDFVFQISTRKYRVTRQIKVGRNDNANENQSLAEVEWDQEHKTYTELTAPLTKKNEIKERIEELLGFDAEQFKQIVILPQGKFQQLLLSSVDDKGKILTQLFNAEIYENITTQLQEDSKEFKKEIQDKKNRITARLESIGIDSQEVLGQLILDQQNTLNTLKNELPLSEETHKLAQHSYQEARQLADLFLEFETSVQLLAKHNEQKDLIQIKENQKQQAEKAEVLRPSIEEIIRTTKLIQDKKEHIQTYYSIIISREAKLRKLDVLIQNLEDQRPVFEEKKIQVSKLEEFRPRFAELDKIKGIIRAQESELSHKQNDIQLFEVNLQNKEDKLENENVQKLEELENMLRQKVALDHQMQQFESWKTLRKDYHSARQKYKNLEKQKKTALQELDLLGKTKLEKQTLYNNLERQWRLSQAAALAETLENNQPCPVCGSTQHPYPAQKNETYVSDQQITDAKQTEELATQRYDQSRERFSKIDKDLGVVEETGKRLADQLGEVKNWEDAFFVQQENQLKENYQNTLQAEKKIEVLKAENQKLRSEIKELKERIQIEREKYQQLQNQIFEKKTEQKSIEQNLPSNIHSEHELDEHVEALQDEIETFLENLEKSKEEKNEILLDISNRNTEVKKDEREIKNLESDLDDRERKLARDLKAKGFKNTEEIQYALRSDDEREALRKAIEHWNTRATELRTQLRQAEEKIAGREKPVLSEMLEHLNLLELELNERKKNIHQLAAHIASLEIQAKEIRKIHQDLLKIEEKAAHVIQLAELANGQNDLNQKFQTYVLSVFLDDVVDYANKRLRILSQDRYQLHRTEEVLHGNRKAGLDLIVFDSYSGKERLVHNLSGGETFFTSLALALGLADVATANAGGIRLDAMFIDEGFGTLDSETLDLAIKTLMNLDGEYRLVGIISHVAELKERIPSNRLEVIKGRHGSTIKIHTGNRG